MSEMSDYTPTTNEVRDRFAQLSTGIYDKETEGAFLAAFDRWLAAHDAEVHQRGREDHDAESAEVVEKATTLAYKTGFERGREVAAKAVETELRKHGFYMPALAAVAAARGNTEERTPTSGSHTEGGIGNGSEA